LHVYDKSGSIELKVPLKTSVDDLIPGHTVISLENASCAVDERGVMRLIVPSKMKYS
jgi:hypothetical protein